MLASPKLRDSWKKQSVKDICSEGERYYASIRDKRRTGMRDPILRAVFQADEINRLPVLSRAAPVALASLNADLCSTLRRMVEMCEDTTQFVAWLSVEDLATRTIDHACVIVDRDTPSGPVWEGEVHDPIDYSISRRKRAGSVGGISSSTAYISGDEGGNNDDEEEGDLEFFERRSRTTAGSTSFKESRGPYGTSANRRECAASLSMMDAVRQGKKTEELLKIALLSSEAAAKVVVTVEEVDRRVKQLEASLAPITTGSGMVESTMNAVLQKLDDMDHRMHAIERYAASVEAKNQQLEYQLKHNRSEKPVQTDVQPQRVETFTQTETFDLARMELLEAQRVSAKEYVDHGPLRAWSDGEECCNRQDGRRSSSRHRSSSPRYYDRKQEEQQTPKRATSHRTTYPSFVSTAVQGSVDSQQQPQHGHSPSSTTLHGHFVMNNNVGAKLQVPQTQLETSPSPRRASPRSPHHQAYTTCTGSHAVIADSTQTVASDTQYVSSMSHSPSTTVAAANVQFKVPTESPARAFLSDRALRTTTTCYPLATSTAPSVSRSPRVHWDSGS